MTKKIIFAIPAVIIIIVIIAAIIRTQLSPVEREFNGYVLWLREAVVFTDNVKFKEGENFPTLGNLTWVEEDDTVNSFYSKAQTLIESEYDFDDIRIIKVQFKGLYKEGGRYGHLGKYASKVTVTDIISYSNDIGN